MMHAHFIGIGGAGMSVVAQLFLARGYRVSGSDARDSDVLASLRHAGAQVWVGHDAGHVTGADCVVVSTAVRPDNPELVAAHACGIEVIHRSVALARAARGLDFVAVAGAHGKTTTTGMLAAALSAAGADPSFAIGGQLMGTGQGAHLGTGAAFIAEADESDLSFLNYEPKIAVVTNVEADHLDRYGSSDAVHEAFDDFVERIVPGGLLVACADDPGSARLAQSAADRGIRVQRYGLAESIEDQPGRPSSAAPDVLLHEVQLLPTGARATIGGHRVPMALSVDGIHNVRNAAAAWCVGVELGIEPARMATALTHFTGTARRFQLRGTAAGVRVIDDYAHHPTEVGELLTTARRFADGGRVLVLFQPHLYSRTQAFADEFRTALCRADEIVVTAIYGAREDPRPGVTSGLITDGHEAFHDVPDRLEAARQIAAMARTGDVVLTVGAGDVTELGPVILDELGNR